MRWRQSSDGKEVSVSIGLNALDREERLFDPIKELDRVPGSRAAASVNSVWVQRSEVVS
jgi:hypothetical protein